MGGYLINSTHHNIRTTTAITRKDRQRFVIWMRSRSLNALLVILTLVIIQARSRKNFVFRKILFFSSDQTAYTLYKALGRKFGQKKEPIILRKKWFEKRRKIIQNFPENRWLVRRFGVRKNAKIWSKIRPNVWSKISRPGSTLRAIRFKF